MTLGDTLLKKIILARQVQWQYQLENYTVEALKSITKSLDKARSELFDYVQNRDIILPEGREDKVLKELNNLTFGIQEKLTGDISEASEIAGQASLREYGQIMSLDGRLAETVGFDFVSLSPAQLKAMVVDVPVGGKLLKDWVADNFERQIVDEIQTEIMAGMFKGDSTKALVDRLRGSFGMLDHEAITLTRTYVASMNNRAAEMVYKANSDVIEKERWISTLEVSTKTGAGTCFQCAAMDGREWPIGTDHPRPLAHQRCRCFLVPITKSFKALGLNIPELEEAARPFKVVNGIPVDDGGKKRVLDFGMFDGNAQAFIESKGPLFMKNVVGPGRKALIDAGKIEFKDLVDKDGNVVLLKDLPKLDESIKAYRYPDSTVKGLKKSLLDAETGIYLRKTEKAYLFDPEGKELFNKSGNKNSVGFTQEEANMMKGNILTHNHPYGTSFSLQDIKLLLKTGLKEIRAVGAEYKYAFSLKGASQAKDDALKMLEKEYQLSNSTVKGDFLTKMDKGEIDIEYAEKNHAHTVWLRVNKYLPWIDYRRKEWKK